MKNLSFLFLFVTLLFFGCNITKKVDCGDIICTQEFKTIQVKFTDENGAAIEVLNYSAVNQRTGKKMSAGKMKSDDDKNGYYIIASDSNLKDLSADGDVIVVSARNPKSGEIESTEFKVLGGVCNCHVNKATGPDEIAMD